MREVKLQWSGFATSLMERLGYTLGMCVLEMNYRSHPNVVTPFSDLFYGSMVESAKSASEFPAIKGIYWPKDARLIFVDVKGVEQNESGGIHNPKQVDCIRDIINQVMNGPTVAPRNPRPKILPPDTFFKCAKVKQ